MPAFRPRSDSTGVPLRTIDGPAPWHQRRRAAARQTVVDAPPRALNARKSCARSPAARGPRASECCCTPWPPRRPPGTAPMARVRVSLPTARAAGPGGRRRRRRNRTSKSFTTSLFGSAMPTRSFSSGGMAAAAACADRNLRHRRPSAAPDGACMLAGVQATRSATTEKTVRDVVVPADARTHTRVVGRARARCRRPAAGATPADDESAGRHGMRRPRGAAFACGALLLRHVRRAAGHRAADCTRPRRAPRPSGAAGGARCRRSAARTGKAARTASRRNHHAVR